MTALPLQNKVAHIDQTDFETRVNEVRFDGYVQRTVVGLRNYTQSYSIQWVPLTETERDTLQAYFVERGGWQDIDYEGQVWVCKRHSHNLMPNVPNHYQYFATLELK